MIQESKFRLPRLRTAFLCVSTIVFYISIQFIFWIQDRSEMRELSESICRSVEIYLQTGAVREVVEFADASIRIAKPGRAKSVILSENGLLTQVGDNPSSSWSYSCSPVGRGGISATIFIEKRHFNGSFVVVIGVSLLLSIFTGFAFLLIQKLTLRLFSSELTRVFNPELDSKDLSLLNRLLALSDCESVAKARETVRALKIKVDSQASQLRDQSVKAAVGEMVSHVAHDMRSPLSVLALLSEAKGGERDQLISKAIARLQLLADEVLNTRKKLNLKTEECSLQLVLEAVKADFKIRFPDLKVNSEDANARLEIKQELLTRILTILLENSAEATKGRGEVRINADLDGKRLTVIDSGPGFADEMLDADPKEWRTSKQNGNGLGLLFIRKSMAEIGGSLTLGNNSSGVGAMISIQFS